MGTNILICLHSRFAHLCHFILQCHDRLCQSHIIFFFLRVTLLLNFLFLSFSLNSECAEVWLFFVWVWRAQDWDPVLLSRGIA